MSSAPKVVACQAYGKAALVGVDDLSVPPLLIAVLHQGSAKSTAHGRIIRSSTTHQRLLYRRPRDGWAWVFVRRPIPNSATRSSRDRCCARRNAAWVRTDGKLQTRHPGGEALPVTCRLHADLHPVRAEGFRTREGPTSTQQDHSSRASEGCSPASVADPCGPL
jgi:hypothetical protein